MKTAEELCAALEEVILSLRVLHDVMRKEKAVTGRHRVWLGLWQRGYSLSEIAMISGYSRERVRMVLKRMGALEARAAAR